ncbi:ISC system 2Fe-2S type ferredoxin [Ningiella sp. W23]|uniref:ISC system 2Fe-2S type ferredoxin n=1 Tax=Ningiella sp. W23 TaxID=3023715 RepID=UPI003756F5D5
MPQLIFLPNKQLCPDGAAIEVKSGSCILDVALEHKIEINHYCSKSCACATCHVMLREGFDSVEAADELEACMLEKTWGADAQSRLSCQTKIRDEDLVVEIPNSFL